jgi:hypothetical protein
MPEFPAETYTPRGAPVPRPADAARAAGQASQPGAPVRFLHAIVVPEEETCFWLYQAPSAGAVRAAMTRAGLRPDRITPAISIRPPDPAPGTGGQAGHPRPHPTRPEPPAARRAPARGAADA